MAIQHYILVNLHQQMAGGQVNVLGSAQGISPILDVLAGSE